MNMLGIQCQGYSISTPLHLQRHAKWKVDFQQPWANTLFVKAKLMSLSQLTFYRFSLFYMLQEFSEGANPSSVLKPITTKTFSSEYLIQQYFREKMYTIPSRKDVMWYIDHFRGNFAKGYREFAL